MWTMPCLIGLLLMLLASAETNTSGNQQSLKSETTLAVEFDDSEMLQEVNSIQI